MGKRIKSEASSPLGCSVTTAAGDPGVTELMTGQGDHQSDQDETEQEPVPLKKELNHHSIGPEW